MKEQKHFITCTSCGKILFKCNYKSEYTIDVQCPRCGSAFSIEHTDNKISLQETQNKYKTIS